MGFKLVNHIDGFRQIAKNFAHQRFPITCNCVSKLILKNEMMKNNLARLRGKIVDSSLGACTCQV